MVSPQKRGNSVRKASPHISPSSQEAATAESSPNPSNTPSPPPESPHPPQKTAATSSQPIPDSHHLKPSDQQQPTLNQQNQNSPIQCPALGINSDTESTPTTPIPACTKLSGDTLLSPPNANTGCVNFPSLIDALKNSASTPVVAKYPNPLLKNPGLLISLTYLSKCSPPTAEFPA